MECFTVYADEIEGRIDPFYYRSEFVELNKKLENSRYRLIELREYIKSFDTGKNLKQISKSKDAVQFIRTQNVRPIYLETEGISYTKDRSSLKKTNLIDVLFVRVGVGVGDCCAISKEQVGFTFSDNVIKISLEEGINPFYLTIYLDSTIGKTIFGRGKKGSGKPVISQENISNISVPLPPIQTQNRITQLMGNAYEIKKQKETEAQQLIDSINDYVLSELGIKLPELKDEMYYMVYADEVKNNRCDAYYYQPKFEEVEEAIKRGTYKTKKFNEIAKQLINGLDFRKFSEDGLTYIRVSNINPNSINNVKVRYIPPINISKKIHLKSGNLLITRKGTFGVAAVVEKNHEEFIISSEIFKIELEQEQVNPFFISIWMNSYAQKIIFDRIKTGGIMGHISQEALSDIIIPLPPLSIQNKIADEVKARMQKSEQLQKEAKEVLEEAKERVERIIMGEEEI